MINGCLPFYQRVSKLDGFVGRFVMNKAQSSSSI